MSTFPEDYTGPGSFEVTIVHYGGERKTLRAIHGSFGQICVLWSTLNPPMRFNWATGIAVLQKQQARTLAPESRKPAGYVPPKKEKKP